MEKIDPLYRDYLVIAVQLLLLSGLTLAVVKMIRAGSRHMQSSEFFSRFGPRIGSGSSRLCRNVVVGAALAGTALLGTNLYLMSRRTDLLTLNLAVFSGRSAAAWINLGKQLATVTVLLLAAPRIISFIHRQLLQWQARAKAFEHIRANDASIERFFTAVDRIQRNAIWLLTGAVSARILPVPEAVFPGVLTALKLYLIISLGLLAVKAVAVMVDTIDALSRKYARRGVLFELYESLKQLVPLLRRILEYMVYVWVATLAVLQIQAFAALARYGTAAIQILGVFFLCRVVVELSNLLLEKSLLRNQCDLTDRACQQRVTIVPLIKSVSHYVIYFGTCVLIVRAMGINPAPILAGAGIMGVVVGLGAQSLINDIVSGFFILFENHYLVGDYIETGAAQGIVESIEIRTTRIRNPNGQLHILRNGQLGEIVNYSKQFTKAVVEVGVDYGSDLDRVYRVIAECGRQLREQNDQVLAPTTVDGLEQFGESELLIRSVTKVKPGSHNAVARQLRKLIKEAFDREHIEIPFARRVLILKNEPQAPKPDCAAAG